MKGAFFGFFSKRTFACYIKQSSGKLTHLPLLYMKRRNVSYIRISGVDSASAPDISGKNVPDRFQASRYTYTVNLGAICSIAPTSIRLWEYPCQKFLLFHGGGIYIVNHQHRLIPVFGFERLLDI